MAGYNFVNGALKKVDDADFSAASKAQVYMSDAEYSARGATIKAPYATSGGTPSPTIASPTAGLQTNNKGIQSSTIFQPGVDVFGFKTGANEKLIPGIGVNRWGSPVQDKAGNYFVNNTATSPSQINDIYNTANGTKAPVVPDTPAMQPSTPISENVAQAIPTIAQPTRSDPLVQAAGTAEVKKIQDTYGRQDTIVSEPDSKIYKVRAGYRRKSKLGS